MPHYYDGLRKGPHGQYLTRTITSFQLPAFFSVSLQRDSVSLKKRQNFSTHAFLPSPFPCPCHLSFFYTLQIPCMLALTYDAAGNVIAIRISLIITKSSSVASPRRARHLKLVLPRAPIRKKTCLISASKVPYRRCSAQSGRRYTMWTTSAEMLSDYSYQS